MPLDLTWHPVTDDIPAEDVVVVTRLDDHKGVRNEQPLRRVGRLWYFPDGSAHVQYDPTHWRPLSAEEKS
jgi:hypothetical protein